MNRADLPLLLAADELAPAQEPEALDRLRLQKGVFILQMAGDERWRNLFDFEPWDWGPFSRELTREIAQLVNDNLLEIESVPGRRYPRYRTTYEGDARVAKLLEEMDSKHVEFVSKVRAYVTSRSFSQLLREVYGRFPDYAVNSRFQS